jgi:hypothetical protein
MVYIEYSAWCTVSSVSTVPDGIAVALFDSCHHVPFIGQVGAHVLELLLPGARVFLPHHQLVLEGEDLSVEDI